MVIVLTFNLISGLSLTYNLDAAVMVLTMKFMHHHTSHAFLITFNVISIVAYSFRLSCFGLSKNIILECISEYFLVSYFII